MARIQILELPTEHRGDDMITPFAVIIDQADEATCTHLTTRPEREGLAEQLGARCVLAFEETVEIPANEVELSDGHVVRLNVEADLTAFGEQVQQAVLDAQRRLTDAVKESRHG